MKLNLSSISNYPAPIRIGMFVLALLLLWAPFAGGISILINLRGAPSEQTRNLVSILTMLLLYVEFLLLVHFWGRHVYRQPNLIWHYGLELSRRFGLELLAGLAIGVASLLALFATQGILGWVLWQSPSISTLHIALEGLLVALGIGLAEELLFRGWLLDELKRDYQPTVVLWSTALTFAVLHFIKPLDEIRRTFPQFPALLILGLILVWAKRSQGDFYQFSRSRWSKPTRRDRLGLPLGLHAGLVWGYYIVNVGNLVKYSGQVPEWVTGIDRNPLSGAIGLLFLSALAFGVWQFSKVQQLQRK